MITDLKQFIAATVQQATSGLATKDDIARLDAKIDGVEQRLTVKIEETQTAIDNTLNDYFKEADAYIDKRFDDHEKRIVRLERRAA